MTRTPDKMREALYAIIALDHHNHGPASRATEIARAALSSIEGEDAVLSPRDERSDEQEIVEDVARALYECWPDWDSGEAVDGFQVTPAGPIPWSSIVEMDNDEPYRVAARAAIAAIAKAQSPDTQ